MKAGNKLLFEPTSDELVDQLSETLSYTEIVALKGREEAIARRAGKPPVVRHKKYVYDFDHKGRMWCPFGFFDRVWNKLSSNGWAPKWVDVEPHDNPSVYVPDWDSLYDFAKLHELQDRMFVALVAGLCGRISAAPGFGKTFSMQGLMRLFPKARIDVVIPSVNVAKQLYHRCRADMVADVGLIGGGKRELERRVQIITADSLRHSDYKADILIADEVHEMAAPSYIPHLARYQRSRNYGFSATHDKRLDKRDVLIEGFFGPILYRVSYQQCQAAGLVAPVVVHWADVPTTTANAQATQYVVRASRQRHALWKNKARNLAIARDARRYTPDVQTLIVVETLEHAMALRKLLPEFTPVYGVGSMTEERFEKFRKEGCLGDRDEIMTPKMLDRLRDDFESGVLKKAIATTIWNVGVDFQKLSVLIRADGAASATLDLQIPGRATRIIRDGTETKVAILHDYLDQFNKTFERRANGRRRSYKSYGWKQVLPEKPKSDPNFERTLFDGMYDK